jgi:hypothetical protein
MKPVASSPALEPGRVVPGLCLGIIAVVLASLVGATLVHELEVLRSSRIRPAYPPILYGLMPSPGTSPVDGAPGAAGGDFSQVYTSALALRHGESPYFPATPAFADRFGRPAGYPPLMNWLYVPLTFLSYYEALLVHCAFWLLALFAVTAVILWRMELARHIPLVLLAQSSLYFLTPVGFTHLERGQFDLLVATASALCVACIFLPRGVRGAALASGVLSAASPSSDSC